jgi:hypothetical protein
LIFSKKYSILLIMDSRKDKVEIRKWIGTRSQKAASLELGCPPAILSNWLSGNREISQVTMIKWSKITGIPSALFAMSKLEQLESKTIE